MSIFPYDDPVDLASAGMDERKLAAAVKEFRNQHARGSFPGGQMVVRRNGSLVLNEVCGVGRGWREDEGIPPMQVKPDTPFPVLSAGKPLAAVAIAMLEDRGLVQVETPVVEYIPEFAKHGKGEITILDVLTHCSGISLPDLVEDMGIWNDRQALLERLIEARPVHRRGTMMYAAYEYGWLLSELFLRITGRPLPAFIEEELSVPLELPALKLGLAGRDADQIAWSYWLGKDKVIVSQVNVAENFEERNNSLQQINSLNPAVSCVTDAASLAAFYQFLVQGGITHTGERLISQEILNKYTTKNVFGLDRSSRFFSSLGRGFMVGARFVSSFGWWGTQACFGHAGGFSSMAFGDHDTKIAVGIVTNGNRDFIDVIKRFPPLCQKLRRACI
jgi:CubicO group peptidase (beta-lactamase class C family)